MLGALVGCTIPKDIDPREIYRQVSGKEDEARLPPPGLDQSFPNLSQVPPRPERPPLTLRESVSAGLAADRERSRQPLAPRAGIEEAGPVAAAPGQPPIAGGPPSPPRLAVAPAIPWSTALPPARSPAGPATTSGAERTGPRSSPPGVSPPPEMPPVAPAPPPPDLLAPSGPPPLPTQDLLAPAPR